MAKYTKQPNTTLPNKGNNLIHHLVKTFESLDSSALDVEMNLWFASLEALVVSPIIQRVNFNTLVKGNNPNKDETLYQSQVHYMLVD